MKHDFDVKHSLIESTRNGYSESDDEFKSRVMEEIDAIEAIWFETNDTIGELLRRLIVFCGMILGLAATVLVSFAVLIIKEIEVINNLQLEDGDDELQRFPTELLWIYITILALIDVILVLFVALAIPS